MKLKGLTQYTTIPVVDQALWRDSSLVKVSNPHTAERILIVPNLISAALRQRGRGRQFTQHFDTLYPL